MSFFEGGIGAHIQYPRGGFDGESFGFVAGGGGGGYSGGGVEGSSSNGVAGGGVHIILVQINRTRRVLTKVKER